MFTTTLMCYGKELERFPVTQGMAEQTMLYVMKFYCALRNDVFRETWLDFYELMHNGMSRSRNTHYTITLLTVLQDLCNDQPQFQWIHNETCYPPPWQRGDGLRVHYQDIFLT